MKDIILNWYAKNRQKLRISVFLRLSTNKYCGQPKIVTATQFVGKGKISFGKFVQLGYNPSPFFNTSVIYLEARSKEAKICFGDNITVNNGLTIICENSSVTILDNTLIGTNVEIIDSDFHGISPQERLTGKHKAKSVLINENVFIGSNVKICKGVTIGKNSIISNGSVVFESIPENTIAQGNPAKAIKKII
jgi:acetyltransferase-like isoleucine patch superfamily enzyme